MMRLLAVVLVLTASVSSAAAQPATRELAEGAPARVR
jgi:hypothetical protein